MYTMQRPGCSYCHTLTLLLLEQYCSDSKHDVVAVDDLARTECNGPSASGLRLPKMNKNAWQFPSRRRVESGSKTHQSCAAHPRRTPLSQGRFERSTFKVASLLLCLRASGLVSSRSLDTLPQTWDCHSFVTPEKLSVDRGG